MRRALALLGWEGARLVWADTYLARLRGALALWPIRAGEPTRVLAFPRCHSVHTCFMPMALDIAFIDAAGEVLSVHEVVGPWRFLSEPGAAMVLERVRGEPAEEVSQTFLNLSLDRARESVIVT